MTMSSTCLFPPVLWQRVGLNEARVDLVRAAARVFVRLPGYWPRLARHVRATVCGEMLGKETHVEALLVRRRGMGERRQARGATFLPQRIDQVVPNAI